MDETPLIYIPNTKIKEIETNIKTDTFVLKLRQYAEKLLQWEAIYFSDIVTQIAGLSQLTYESEWYCFGEDDRTTTSLNSAQTIRLEYAILGILKSIITEIKKTKSRTPIQVTKKLRCGWRMWNATTHRKWAHFSRNKRKHILHTGMTYSIPRRKTYKIPIIFTSASEKR